MGADLATLFLCGDVMTGRGVDQILARPGDPRLREPSIDDAREYLTLARAAHGDVPRRVQPEYVWGEALAELDRARPDARIVNLETSVTRSAAFALDKEVHYRMNPENVGCLTAAGIDVAVLANNHVLDFGPAGLVETLATLSRAGLGVAGAGLDEEAARRPAVVELASGRRLVVAGLGSATSGIPAEWAATPARPGVALLPDLSEGTAERTAESLRPWKRRGDLLVASIHWGGNWGFDVPGEMTRFAHTLVDGGVDVVHGHSSHHVRPIEVYRGRLVLYGCGDFIDDYEGIEGYEAYRGDLVVMYLATLDAVSGELAAMRMVPLQARKLRLARPSREDVRWLAEKLARESERFGSSIAPEDDGALWLRWPQGPAAVPPSIRGV